MALKNSGSSQSREMSDKENPNTPEPHMQKKIPASQRPTDDDDAHYTTTCLEYPTTSCPERSKQRDAAIWRRRERNESTPCLVE
ncbi:hypothetical protein VTJ04DRAFT_339 [Mycothermus thermophilus]|uniref:uncharacterized protein n=1 Tax=Humicola insolens TaxID=85995 RepID=UPI00374453D1